MAATDAHLINAPGVYAIGLWLPESQRISVGALGEIVFLHGFYVYVGSAWGPGGLAARLRRHLDGGTVRHWHIDYLRTTATPFAVWQLLQSADECSLAQQLQAMKGAHIPAQRFGASDCRCVAHLVRFDSLNDPATLVPGALFSAL